MGRDDKMEEDDYEGLFKNAWCPLFGKLPTLNDPPSAQTSRCIRTIEEARALWGLIHYPEFPTSWPEPESISDEFFQYPTWKTKAARSIAIATESILKYTQWYAMPSGIDLTATPDISYPKAIQQARCCTIPPLNENITDAEILALLAIEEAWSVLGDILYYDEKESEILKQAQIAGMLLLRAKEIASSETIESMKPLAKIGEETLDYTQKNFFRKEGDTWYIKLNDAYFTLNHYIGLEYIQHLMKNPFPAKNTLDGLYQAINGVKISSKKEDEAIEEGLTVSRYQKCEKKRDRESTLELKRRLDTIGKEIADKIEIAKETNGDIDMENLLDEKTKIEKELKTPNRISNPEYKKKYDAVYRAITRTLESIKSKSESVGEHFENALHYKNSPFYYKPEKPTPWEFD